MEGILVAILVAAVVGAGGLAKQMPRTFMRMSRGALEAMLVALIAAAGYELALWRLQGAVFALPIPDALAVGMFDSLERYSIPAAALLLLAGLFVATLALRKILKVGEEEREIIPLPSQPPGLSRYFWRTSAAILGVAVTLLLIFNIQAARQISTLEVAQRLIRENPASPGPIEEQADGRGESSTDRPTKD